MKSGCSAACEEKTPGKVHANGTLMTHSCVWLYSKRYPVCVLESATTPTTFTTESQSTASTPTTPTESTVSTVTTTATTASTGTFLLSNALRHYVLKLVIRNFATTLVVWSILSAIKFSHMKCGFSAAREDKTASKVHDNGTLMTHSCVWLYTKWYPVCVLESVTTPTTFTTESQSTASTPTTPTESTVSTVTTMATTASTGTFLLSNALRHYFVEHVILNFITTFVVWTVVYFSGSH